MRCPWLFRRLLDRDQIGNEGNETEIESQRQSENRDTAIGRCRWCAVCVHCKDRTCEQRVENAFSPRLSASTAASVETQARSRERQTELGQETARRERKGQATARRPQSDAAAAASTWSLSLSSARRYFSSNKTVSFFFSSLSRGSLKKRRKDSRLEKGAKIVAPMVGGSELASRPASFRPSKMPLVFEERG